MSVLIKQCCRLIRIMQYPHGNIFAQVLKIVAVSILKEDS
jgi:hypothetical protein